MTSLLVVATAETIAGRRATYSAAYLSEVRSAYHTMKEHFPELVELHTDPGQPMQSRVEGLMAGLIRG